MKIFQTTSTGKNGQGLKGQSESTAEVQGENLFIWVKKKHNKVAMSHSSNDVQKYI